MLLVACPPTANSFYKLRRLATWVIRDPDVLFTQYLQRLYPSRNRRAQ
jgi:hypothetical protein